MKKDKVHVPEDLLGELAKIRQRVAGLEAIEGERKRAEEALRESQQRYRMLAENSAVGIWHLSEDGYTIYLNPAMCAMLEIRGPEELAGMTLARQQDHRVPGVYEYRIARLDGEVRTVQASSVPISYKGQPATLAVLRDVTELLRAAEAVEQLRRQNELILHSAGEGICGLDLEGKITFANPAAARMAGWDIEELIGQPMHAILHHSKSDGTPYRETACPLCAVFTDGTVHRIDTEVFWRKDGTSFPVEYIRTPIREHAELVGAVVTFKDITVERQTERLAMLGRVAAGVAHELNNALGVVLACSQLLLRRTDPASEAYHDLELIEKYAETCGRIAQELRRLGRPLPLKRELVDLLPLIEETLKPLELSLASQKVHLKVIADPRLPLLSADPRLLGQALLNLISNAAEAMPEGGILTIAARMRQKESVEIAVSDTGAGIPRESLSRIFEPFFTTKSRGEGMGLGLTLTSRIVQDHGGRLEVKSEVGRGSTFRVTLQLLHTPESTSQPLDR